MHSVHVRVIPRMMAALAFLKTTSSLELFLAAILATRNIPEQPTLWRDSYGARLPTRKTRLTSAMAAAFRRRRNTRCPCTLQYQCMSVHVKAP